MQRKLDSPRGSMPLVVGADGCKAGWIAVARDLQSGELSHRVVPALSDLLSLAPDVLAVDMPIGLPDAGPRACDRAARKFLGEPRRRSVFPAPVRGMLATEALEEAERVLRKADGRGLQRQVWFLIPKIREVDDLVRSLSPGDAPRVIEVHPEVSFAAWNDGEPMVHAKRTPEGRRERQALIGEEYGPGAFSAIRNRASKPDAADDDVADAFAALWTAERFHAGTATALPGEGRVDREEVEMVIWF